MDIENQNARDARVEKLWKKLDIKQKGELDLEDLQKGLHKIDHPLKNASGLLLEVMKAVDTSGDGKIQYEEFRIFVEQTEKELHSLFQSIDKDKNGKLDKEELQVAFKNAGLQVLPSKLNQFFSEVDTDRDGVITFEEWRNFLLFLPADAPGLKAVLNYYSSTVTLNAEGDAVFSDETIQGLGIVHRLFTSLFGSITQIVSPTVRQQQQQPKQPSQTITSPHSDLSTLSESAQAQESGQFSLDYPSPKLDSTMTSPKKPLNLTTPKNPHLPQQAHDEPDFSEDIDVSKPVRITSLTLLLPDPGYFAAGGIAGVISRTATAPLDRLKVYLIANTGDVTKSSVDAVKKGDAVAAVKKVGRPLFIAVQELWRAGGMRSLFAGNGLNVIKVMPESAIKFGSYEGSKRALAHLEGHGDPTHINPYSRFVAGGLGGMVSQLCVYPLDTLKFRMQCNVEAAGLQGNALIMETAKQMYRSGGLISAYRGLTMGLVGMFPYSAIDLGTFEFLKSRIIAYNAQTMNLPIDDDACRPGSFATGTIGAFSGAFGASVVYPINLLRTRLQAQGTILHPQTYTGVVDCAKKTIKKEGMKGLFKGITPNLLKVVPSVSITYVVYENSKKLMHLH